MSPEEWTRSQRIALAGLLIGIVACVAAVLVVPEFRRMFGLKSSSASSPAIEALANNPANENQSKDKNINSNHQTDAKKIDSHPEGLQDSNESPKTKQDQKDEAEVQNSSSNLQSVSPGRHFTGSMAENVVKEYLFRGSANTTVIFTIQKGKGNPSCSVQIFDSKGLKLLEDQAYPVTVEIRFTPKTDGTYTVRLQGLHDFGDYTLVMNYVSGAESNRNRIIPIGLDEDKTGDLAPDSVDEYSFRGSANTPIVFTIQKGKGNPSCSVQIFDIKGLKLLEDQAYPATVKILFTPKTDGIYTIRLQGLHDFGGYVIALSRF